MEIKDYCTGIQHVGIPTNDIQLSINFYQQLVFHLALFTNNNDEMVAFLKLHNLVIEIYENTVSLSFKDIISLISSVWISREFRYVIIYR